MIPAPLGRFASFRSELLSLSSGLWAQLKSEMGGKAALSKRQVALMAAGGVTALTGLVFFLTALTLLLTHTLVLRAGWSFLAAGAAAAGAMAALFSLGGLLLINRSKAKLAAESPLPKNTIESLRLSTLAMTNPFIAPVSNIHPLPNTMNARNAAENHINRTAACAEDQFNRARRGIGETLHSFADKIEAAPLLASALGWAETLMNPASRDRAFAVARTAAVLPARHPIPAVLVGAGLGWMLWRQITREDLEETITGAAGQARAACDRTSKQAAQVYSQAAETAYSAGTRFRDNASDTVHRWADTARGAATTVKESATEAANRARGYYDDARATAEEAAEYARNGAHRAREEAEAGLNKARDFAREQPVLALAGAAALGALVVLLSKSASSRR